MMGLLAEYTFEELSATRLAEGIVGQCRDGGGGGKGGLLREWDRRGNSIELV